MAKALRRKTVALGLALVLVLAMVGVSGCGDDNGAAGGSTIVFADYNWDSALFHNRVAQFIVENGYGYSTDSIPGETIPLTQGTRNGDVDVSMEIWVQNAQEAYDAGISAGDLVDLGTNFNDNVQGLFVPAYVIEGDPARGIEPMAPDLRSIEDLPRYWELFQDPEDTSKGRFYGGVPGWEADAILATKFETYGLDQYYNVFRPGSGAALAASLVSAYNQGEPWFGYYWGPTWIFGILDLIQIEEPPYDEATWEQGYGTAFPAVDVNIVVNHAFPENHPELTEFLTNYETTSDMISEALAYMENEGASVEEAALWFLQEYEDVWSQWVPADVAQRVKEAL